MASRAERETPTNRSQAAATTLISVLGPVSTTQGRPSFRFTSWACRSSSSNTSPPPVIRDPHPGRRPVKLGRQLNELPGCQGGWPDPAG